MYNAAINCRERRVDGAMFFAQLRPVSRRSLVLLHFPILFLHSLFYFLLCRLHLDMHDSFEHFKWFIGLYSLLLVLNAAWMLVLMAGRLDAKPEDFWMWNNLTFAVLGIVLMVIAQSLSLPGSLVLWVATGLFFGEQCHRSGLHAAGVHHGRVNLEIYPEHRKPTWTG